MMNIAISDNSGALTGDKERGNSPRLLGGYEIPDANVRLTHTPGALQSSS